MLYICYGCLCVQKEEQMCQHKNIDIMKKACFNCRKCCWFFDGSDKLVFLGYKSEDWHKGYQRQQPM